MYVMGELISATSLSPFEGVKELWLDNLQEASIKHTPTCAICLEDFEEGPGVDWLSYPAHIIIIQIALSRAWRSTRRVPCVDIQCLKKQLYITIYECEAYIHYEREM